MSKGFWIALAFLLAILFSSLALYIYAKEALFKATEKYLFEDEGAWSDDFGN